MAMSKRAAEGAKLLKLGLVKDAARELEAALAQSPDDKEALLGLARLRVATGAPEGARPLFERLLKLAPGHAESLSHLARMRAEKGDAKAVDALRLLAKQPKAGFAELYNLGYVLLNRGEDEEAAQAFVQALKIVPKSGQAVTYLGVTRERAGKLDEALKCYKVGANYAPKEHLPFVLGARVLVKLGQVPQAVSVMKRAVSRAPENAEVRAEYVRLCIFANQPREALLNAIELRAKEPANAQWAYLHGLALLTSGDAKSAAAAFEAATSAAPSSWEAHLGLGKALRLAGREGDGMQAVHKAHALAPDEPGPANELAVWHLGAPGGSARAKALLEPVLAAHPDDPDANLNMALALLKVDRAAAAKHATKAKASTVPAVKEQAERLVRMLGAPSR